MEPNQSLAQRSIEVLTHERQRPSIVIVHERPVDRPRGAVCPQKPATEPRVVGQVTSALHATENRGRGLQVLDGQRRGVPTLDMLQPQLDVPVRRLNLLKQARSSQPQALREPRRIDQRLPPPVVPVPRVLRGSPMRRGLPTRRQHLVNDGSALPDASGHTVQRVVRQRLVGHCRNHRRLPGITPLCDTWLGLAAPTTAADARGKGSYPGCFSRGGAAASTFAALRRVGLGLDRSCPG